MLGSGGFGSCPTIASPGVPEEQVKALRAAFAKALTSAELVAEAKKKGFEPELIDGEELQSLAKEVTAQPPEVIAGLKRFVGE
jgi:tripartite-type tricarboxylate transporter receptor subunit TctC